MRVPPIIAGLFLVLFITQANAQLSAEQQIAKDRGRILYNQYKVAKPELTIAAKAGDRESQYYLAEELRKENQYITTEAHQWYVASAEQGDYYAMFRLATAQSDLCSVMKNCPSGTRTSEDWLKLLWQTVEPLVQNGDGEAMAVMYSTKADLEWLKKSASTGYAPAQRLLANRYKEGKGFFVFPWTRSQATENLLKQAAEGGSPKAMMEYFGLLRAKNDLAEARYWLERAAETGYESGVYAYGYFLAVEPDALGFKANIVKGYALISLLKELDGGGGVLKFVDLVLPEIESRMTVLQITEAEKFSSEWKKTHPPLSFFPPKLGF
ncbi:tetratricopeptide repeat protein [Pseudomonas chlororaphis]|uniref:tetratricopeptide repeat protein n=1 Tax=Pseudomonas chlororaphis TaxID=587753 RepID=UPI0009BDA68C|nr:sel1 repeat family protein [Pseudomonas chlororaphis]AZD02268.1 Tetratricopeptide repeat family protein [Pseudomonas chlororaphis subsp. chlororaphis]MBM0280326.1 sel1 repeat family protein [Pseudomonas chlororaphis]MDO1505034.1 sel1 repeat family protein [Pseudomonas chlororaphis]ORM45007.1 hypothetical protein B6D51_27920 [Pseudomonas chlororaphis subsp. chlororaphis]TWR96152.1 sel1 repeat family protein [Pseudomonas chlororaphis subsp. chlororaphis]